jgi:hypothetical protein
MATDFRRVTDDGFIRVTTDGIERVIIGNEQIVVGPDRDTLLNISGMGVLLYQARGLTQSLEVIDAAHSQGRDLDGALRDLSGSQFRKYFSRITCTDSTAPPLDNVFPGLTVQVECACELCYLTGNPGSPARSAVPGTARIMGNYSFYRPVLTMIVRDVQLQSAEWEANVRWKIDLEEV